MQINTDTATTNTVNVPKQPSRQARRQHERRQAKALRRHLNEHVKGLNRTRGKK